MSNILKEIIANSKFLKHYGVGHDKGGHSGRYPWGSGEEPYQHSGDFLSRVDKLRKNNFTYTDKYGKTWTGDTAIAKSMGLSTTQFRTQYSLAKDEVRGAEVARAKALRESGHSLNEIATSIIPFSSTRSFKISAVALALFIRTSEFSLRRERIEESLA